MILLGVFLLLLAFMLWRHFTWRAQVWPVNGLKPPMYQGHRGYWKEGAQENTLASFKAAKVRGLQMVELDVRLTRDQVPVVFHDGDIKRLGHQDRLVQDLTSQEMSQFVNAPTLEEVLTSSDVPAFINVELKTDKALEGTLEEKVTEVIRRTGSERRILFSSFNPLAIRRLSRLLPQVPRALLVTEEREVKNRIYLRKMWFAPYIHANALHLDCRYVGVEKLKNFTQRGIPVAFWTVNDQSQAQELLKAGALSVITDVLHE